MNNIEDRKIIDTLKQTIERLEKEVLQQTTAKNEWKLLRMETSEELIKARSEIDKLKEMVGAKIIHISHGCWKYEPDYSSTGGLCRNCGKSQAYHEQQ